MEATYFSLWKTVLHSKNLNQGNNRQYKLRLLLLCYLLRRAHIVQ